MNRKNRSNAPIVAMIFVICGSVFPASAGDAMLDSILKHFPGYHVLRLPERDPDLRVFVAQHFRNRNVSIVRADLNGDGTPDYALLLKNDDTGTTKLVVLLCSTDGRCKSVYDLDETASAAFVYLRPIGAGSELSPFDGNAHSSKLALTAVQVNYFEKGAVVLVWNRKLQKIEEVQTED
jgi:hypothetical protein